MHLIIFFLIPSVTAHCSTDDDCEQINMPSSKDKFRKRENYAVHGHSLFKTLDKQTQQLLSEMCPKLPVFICKLQAR